MKTKLAAVLAVVLVASGCASNSTDSPKNTDTPPEDAQNTPENDTDDINDTEPSGEDSSTTTVTYTSSGFQPGTVTIQQGETVVWESEASTPMWVASNQHPVHSQYAGSSLREHCSNGDQNTAAFDQCSTGESFSFTFEKKGEWSYHNHEYSPHQGTVIVE